MWSLLKYEIYKAVKDKQILMILLFIIAYQSYAIISATAFSDNLLAFATRDMPVIILALSLIASEVFASEYSFNTYKDILPYVDKRKVFIIKVVTNAVGICILLILWYVFSLILTIFVDKNFAISSNITSYGNRLIFHFFIVLFNSSFIMIASIVSKKRSVANIFTIIGFLSYSLIPMGNGNMMNYFIKITEWGRSVSILCCMLFLGFYLLSSIICGLIFKKQEVT